MTEVKKTATVRKKLTTSTREKMTGVINAYVTATKENVSEIEAIQEFIDNSFDADSTNIDIVINKEDASFMCSDNGRGIDDEKMKDYVTHFTCLKKGAEKEKNSVGIRGVGSKNAIISLADFGNEKNSTSLACVSSSTDGVNINEAIFTLCENEDIFTSPMVRYNQKDAKKGKGTTVSIKPIRDIWAGLKRTSDYIASVYPYLMNKKGVTVTLNGIKLQSKDRMFLSVLGDDINEDGVYIKDGLVFIVKTYKLAHDRRKNVTKNVKVVYLVVSKNTNFESFNTTFNDEKQFKFGGVYTIYNGRYLDLHKKTEEMASNFPQRGGTGRVRAAIIVDNNEDIFCVKGNKSLGIRELSKNTILSQYSVIGTNDLDFYSVFKTDLSNLYHTMEFESIGKGGAEKDEVKTKESRIISEKIARDIFNGKISAKKAAIEYDAEFESRKKEKTNSKPNKTIEQVSPILNQVTDVEKVLEELEKPIDDRSSESFSTDDKPIDAVIKVYKDSTTGATEYSYVDDAPKDLNKDLIDVVFKCAVKAKIGKTKIELLCAYVASEINS